MCQVTIIGDWKLPQLTFCHKWHTEGGYSEAFSVKKLFQSPNWILAYNPPWQCVRRQLATEKHIFYYSVKMYPCLQYFPIYWSVSNISQYIGLSVINPNLLGVLWNPQDLLLLMGIEISWIVSKIFQFIGLYHRQYYRIHSRSVSPYGCKSHMPDQMADLICQIRWLIPVDYITHQVYQIYLAHQIWSTQQKGPGLTANLRAI